MKPRDPARLRALARPSLLVAAAAAVLGAHAMQGADAATLVLDLAWCGLVGLPAFVLGRAIARQRSDLEAALARARSRHLRLEAVLAAISTAVFVVDGRGWIRRVNRAAEDLCGRPSSLLRGILVDAIVHVGWDSRADESQPDEGRSEIPVRGGEPIPVAWRVIPLVPSRDHLVTLQDLRPHYTALAEIEDRSAQLETSEQTVSRFAASVSHQLATPMGALVVEAGRLLEARCEQPRQRHYISVVNRNARQLSELLDDMVQLTALAADLAEPELEEMTLLRILHDASLPRSDVLDSLAHGRRIPTVEVDPRWLERILREIVDPVPFVGGRATQAHHRLTADRWRLELPSRRLEPGVSDEVVFRPHFPEHEGMSPLSNTRLGLTLARELARGMGGELSTAPGEGEDGRFVLELPLSGHREI